MQSQNSVEETHFLLIRFRQPSFLASFSEIGFIKKRDCGFYMLILTLNY
jgi:hypothetical protein